MDAMYRLTVNDSGPDKAVMPIAERGFWWIQRFKIYHCVGNGIPSWRRNEYN